MGIEIFHMSRSKLYVQVRWGNVLVKLLKKYRKKIALTIGWRPLYNTLVSTHFTRYGNINWAKRTKCNIYNTNKPGHNEGGVRGGRGGGYKELDEDEIEETKCHIREAEQAEAAHELLGLGRVGWEVVELGIAAYLEWLSSINLS